MANKNVVPEAKEALNRFKMEADLGTNLPFEATLPQYSQILSPV